MEAKRLEELEKENDRLKKLLVEVVVDNQILKDINWYEMMEEVYH